MRPRQGRCEADSGDVDCTGRWVDVYGRRVRSAHVAYALTAVQMLSSVLYFAAVRWLRHKLHNRVEEQQLEHACASQFAVFVTGLPPDVTPAEIVRHFNKRYDLHRAAKVGVQEAPAARSLGR